MIPKSCTTLPSAVLVLWLVSKAAAQDNPGRPWHLQVDFGFVNTAGNTSTTTLNANETASYIFDRWTFSQSFATVYGRTADQTTAENYQANLRSDFLFSKRFGWYLLGVWDRNEPGGISRRFEEGSGVFAKILAGPPTTLQFEAGVSAFQQRPVSGAEDRFASGRAALSAKRMLGETSFLQETFEVLPDLKETEDLRFDTKTAFVAPLSKAISFKASYTIRFDNKPEPGRKKSDRFLTSGVTLVF